jgi:predicted PurR-regulated permease PerM
MVKKMHNFMALLSLIVVVIFLLFQVVENNSTQRVLESMQEQQRETRSRVNQALRQNEEDRVNYERCLNHIDELQSHVENLYENTLNLAQRIHSQEHVVKTPF